MNVLSQTTRALAPWATSETAFKSVTIITGLVGVSTKTMRVLSLIAASTLLTSDINPSRHGELVTFTATVTSVAPGTATPVGSVQFKDGLVNLGSPVTLVSGVGYLWKNRALIEMK